MRSVTQVTQVTLLFSHVRDSKQRKKIRSLKKRYQLQSFIIAYGSLIPGIDSIIQNREKNIFQIQKNRTFLLLLFLVNIYKNMVNEKYIW